MRWTTEPPTKPGFYWARASKDDTPQAVHFYPVQWEVYCVGVHDALDPINFRFWSDSPIPEPEGEVGT